jgi:hypothetical protein
MIATVAHDDDAVAIGGDVEFVGDHHDGDAGALLSSLERAPMISMLVRRVEIARRLVRQNHFGLG